MFWLLKWIFNPNFNEKKKQTKWMNKKKVNNWKRKWYKFAWFSEHLLTFLAGDLQLTPKLEAVLWTCAAANPRNGQPANLVACGWLKEGENWRQQGEERSLANYNGWTKMGRTEREREREWTGTTRAMTNDQLQHPHLTFSVDYEINYKICPLKHTLPQHNWYANLGFHNNNTMLSIGINISHIATFFTNFLLKKKIHKKKYNSLRHKKSTGKQNK